MTYLELWEIAESIGFHAGRYPDAAWIDRGALDTLKEKNPDWSKAAEVAYQRGLAAGKRGLAT